MSRLIRTFLNDEDGFSAKDYLMLVFTVPYVLAWFITFIMAIKGVPVDAAIQVLQSMDTTIMTIVGGWFGVTAVSEFVNRNREDEQSTPPMEEIK